MSTEEKSGNSSPRKMVSMLMQPPNQQQLNIQESPFESVYNFYYKQTSEDLRQVLIGEINDPLAIARQFALLVHDQTRKLLPIGRGNVYQDMVQSESLSHKNTRINRDFLKHSTIKSGCPVKKIVKKGYLSLVMQKGVPEPWQKKATDKLTGLLVKSHLTLHYQAGNCNEYAFVALQCLFELKRKLGDDFNNVISNMSVMDSGSPEHHVFVEMDVRIGDQTTKIICDPWAGYVGKIEDAPEDFRVVGKEAINIYGSNAKPLLDSQIVEFAYLFKSYTGNDLSCFDMYHQAKTEGLEDPYYSYLRELPDNLTPEYQTDSGFNYTVNNGEIYDYEGNSQRALEHLNKIVKTDDIPSVIEGRSKAHPFYSQPDHPDLRLQPILQFVPNTNNNDIDHEEKTLDQTSTSPKISFLEDKNSEDTVTNNHSTEKPIVQTSSISLSNSKI
jgi:hypothetical protein